MKVFGKGGRRGRGRGQGWKRKTQGREEEEERRKRKGNFLDKEKKERANTTRIHG